MRYQIIPVTAFEQNCSVLWCEKTGEAAVVDPGGDIDRIVDFLARQQLKLVKVLITHGHVDHAGGAAALVKKYPVPVEGPHLEDNFWLQAMPEKARFYGFPDVEAITPTRWLADGDTVSFGEECLQVIHCPGHTPGHVVFFHPQARLAWVGDVLFAGSIGRTDFPKGDLKTLLHSIREKLFPLGGDIAFIPGHGPMSDFAEEQENNPYCGKFA